jgi:SAM-dependent methyltransferase
MPWAPAVHVPGEGLDDDPTPRPVVRAVLEAALDTGPNSALLRVGNGLFARLCAAKLYAGTERGLGPVSGPLRVLDIGSGYGCWSSEMRRLAHEQGWPVHITGVEINPEREEHLRKWCDEVHVGDWREVLGWLHAIGREFDLVIMNPPFLELLRENGEFPRTASGLPQPARTMVPLLLALGAPAVLALHTQQAFLKSEMGRAVQRFCPPAACWQLPGSVSFREDGKADSRCYEATLWLRDHKGPCSRYLLPELPSEDRRWSVPPGSETPEEAERLGLPMVGDTP